MESIEWRPVPGYEGIYEVSEYGHLKALRAHATTKPGRVMRPCFHPHGYWEYKLSQNGTRKTARAHRLVASAFIGTIEGVVVRHKDDNPANNHYSNLEIGSQRDNARDMKDRGRGRNHHSGQTHCKRGHEFTPENTRITRGGATGRGRACRTCEIEQQRIRRAKRKQDQP